MGLTAFAERLAGSFLVNGSMVILLCGVSIYLSIATGFFQVRKAPEVFRKTFGTLFSRDKKPKKGISPFQAVTTALAGTMGVGNIAGVSTAIIAGGPGAVFWMWVSAFFGMMTKYAEVFLAVKFRQSDRAGCYVGGPMYYMEKGMSKKGLAIIFSVLCIFASFGIGNMTQVNSVSTALKSTFGIAPAVTGVTVAVVCGLVIVGGLRRIGKITEAVIPMISVVYLLGAGMFLYLHRGQLTDTFRLIFSEAFRLRAAGGGIAGYTIREALRFGTARGVFTNEAGLGSAPMAHAAADCESPRSQAMWGIAEVFLDTLLVCTITALVVLTAGGGRLWQCGLDGAPLTSLAFESAFGAAGGMFVSLSLVFFAVPSLLGWYYYGECSVGYLTGGGKNKKRALDAYRFVFLCLTVAGAITDLRLVWFISDILNAFMAVPNVLAIMALRKHVLAGINENPLRTKPKRIFHNEKR